jgi:hypothetical protein
VGGDAYRRSSVCSWCPGGLRWPRGQDDCCVGFSDVRDRLGRVRGGTFTGSPDRRSRPSRCRSGPDDADVTVVDQGAYPKRVRPRSGDRRLGGLRRRSIGDRTLAEDLTQVDWRLIFMATIPLRLFSLVVLQVPPLRYTAHAVRLARASRGARRPALSPLAGHRGRRDGVHQRGRPRRPGRLGCRGPCIRQHPTSSAASRGPGPPGLLPHGEEGTVRQLRVN